MMIKKIKLKKIVCLDFKLYLWSVLMLINISVAMPSTKVKQVKNSYDLRRHIRAISKKNLVNSLRMLVYKSQPNRFFGTKGHKNIQEFLFSTLQNYKTNDQVNVVEDVFNLNTEIGKKLYQDDFDKKIVPIYKPNTSEYQKWDQFKNYMHGLLDKYKDSPGRNFIWEKKGKNNKKVLIVTTHYDTVSHDPKTLQIDPTQLMPGADYNASGMSIALALIKLLHDQNLEHTVRIVFLDAQALGFLGAYDYSQKLKEQKNNIVGVVNLEMLGHDSKHFDKKKKYGNFKVYARKTQNDSEKKDLALYKILENNNKISSVNINFELMQNDFNNSDNFRFWDAGLCAITLSQNWEDDFNPKYQTGNDFPETINQNTFYNAYQYIAQGILGYLFNF